MIASRTTTRRWAAGLVAAWSACAVPAADPSVEPWPLGADVPAFVAPEEPPQEAPPPPEPTEPAAPLSLADALALALSANPELVSSSWEERAAEARAMQAGTVPNPEIDYRYYSLSEDDPADPDDSRHRVILSQVLELGFKRGRRYELAQAERTLAASDYETLRVAVASAVSAEFVAVLGAQRRVQALQESATIYADVHERVTKLVELGSVGSVEAHRTSRALGLARIDLETATAELSTARTRLAATWGSASPRFTEAAGELEPIAPLPALETVLDLARSGPVLARWGVEAERADAALALAKADRVPDLTYGAGVRWEDDSTDPDYLLDVQIALPVFDRNKGGVREARYNLAKTESERRAAEAEAAVELTEAYHACAAAASTAALLSEQVVPAARATYEALATGFERQVSDHDDLLDARRDLARAEVDLVDALVESHQALAALEALVGQPLRP